MYKLCKTEQSAARQRALEECLLTVLEERRFEEITVNDLCQRMGIPRKSFYRYFSSKEGALHALLDHTLLEYERLASPAPGSFRGNSRLSLERFFVYWYKQRRLLDVLKRSGLTGMLVERAVNQALEENQVPSHYLAVDAQNLRGHAIAFAITGLMSMIIQWHHTGYVQTPQEMSQVAVQMLTRPLIPNESIMI